jgi:hypothetical protein
MLLIFLLGTDWKYPAWSYWALLLSSPLVSCWQVIFLSPMMIFLFRSVVLGNFQLVWSVFFFSSWLTNHILLPLDGKCWG